MKKSLNAKNSKDIGRGPLARKVIASAQRHLSQKLTNLADWREARIKAENFQKTIISPNKLTQKKFICSKSLFSVLNEIGSKLSSNTFVT